MINFLVVVKKKLPSELKSWVSKQVNEVFINPQMSTCNNTNNDPYISFLQGRENLESESPVTYNLFSIETFYKSMLILNTMFTLYVSRHFVCFPFEWSRDSPRVFLRGLLHCKFDSKLLIINKSVFLVPLPTRSLYLVFIFRTWKREVYRFYSYRRIFKLLLMMIYLTKLKLCSPKILSTCTLYFLRYYRILNKQKLYWPKFLMEVSLYKGYVCV